MSLERLRLIRVQQVKTLTQGCGCGPPCQEDLLPEFAQSSQNLSLLPQLRFYQLESREK